MPQRRWCLVSLGASFSDLAQFYRILSFGSLTRRNFDTDNASSFPAAIHFHVASVPSRFHSCRYVDHPVGERGGRWSLRSRRRVGRRNRRRKNRSWWVNSRPAFGLGTHCAQCPVRAKNKSLGGRIVLGLV